MSDWSWLEEDKNGNVVFPSMRAVAVYTNVQGQIVIRQEALEGQESDQIIAIPLDYVQNVIDALITQRESLREELEQQ